MAFVTWSLCGTVAICAVTAHVAIPTAIFLAFSSLAGAVFLGSVTAVVLVGFGICAAVLFGFGAIAWTIITSLLSPNDETRLSGSKNQGACGSAEELQDVCYLEGEEDEEEDREDGDGGLEDRAAELSAFFSAHDRLDGATASSGFDLRDEDCGATHLHSHCSSTCPSGTCSSADPDEKYLLDFLSSTGHSTSFSVGGFGEGAGTSSGGHSLLDGKTDGTTALNNTHGGLHPEAHHAPGSSGGAQQPLNGVPAALRASQPTGHRRSHTPRGPTDLTELVLPEYDGETLDVDTMQDGCTFLSLLGKGSFGLVDLVQLRHPDGSTQLAARKTLPHRDVHSYMLLRALQAASGNPFTVSYLGCCEYLADRLEVFMEYAEGGTLEQELEAALLIAQTTDDAPRATPRPPPQLLLPLDRIRVVAASVLLALDGLHSQGMAHLALEAPRHVLLSGTGRVLLGGMSSAARVGSRNHLGRLLGATCCTAPELLRRTRSGKPPRVVAEADLYSVGVLVGMCAFGWREQAAGAGADPAREEEGGSSAAEAAGLVVVGAARRWGEAGVGPDAVPQWVPEDLRQFLSMLMAADPRARPSLEQALGHPFLSCLAEEDVLL